MELHQVVKTEVTLVLPDDDALAVIGHVDHIVSAALVRTARGSTLDSRAVVCRMPRPRFTVQTAVPVRQGVADPALADPDEEVTGRLGHQQRLSRPARIIDKPQQNTNLHL